MSYTICTIYCNGICMVSTGTRDRKKGWNLSKFSFIQFYNGLYARTCSSGNIEQSKAKKSIYTTGRTTTVIGHCSCVVDRIRKVYPLQEYLNEIHDYLWIKTVWGKYGAECMKAGYLAGIIQLPTDNKTKEDTRVEDNKTESLKPESSVEEIENEEPTIFQG